MAQITSIPVQELSTTSDHCACYTNTTRVEFQEMELNKLKAQYADE